MSKGRLNPKRKQNMKPTSHRSSAGSAASIWDLGAPASTSHSSAKSTRFVARFSKSTGRMSPDSKTSRKSKQQTSLLPMFGQEDFPAKTSQLARMGPRAGLKGKRSGLFFEFARLTWRMSPPSFYHRERSRPSLFPRRTRLRNRYSNVGRARVWRGMACA